MTAREKFIARLKELGIYEQWLKEDHVGKVLDDGTIVVMIHVDTDPTDTYTEIRYPSYENVRKNPKSCRKLKEEFYGQGEPEFVAKLAYWLDLPDGKSECPLFPVDLYWAQVEGADWFNYEDDEDEEEYQAFVEKTAEFAGWALNTLDHIRSVVCDAVKTELRRGHNLPSGYSVENGQDHFLDYSFCYVTEEKVELKESGALVVTCTETDKGKKFDSFEIPFNSLSEKQILDIYESMK